MTIALGTRVRDTVTGIEGVVTVRAEYLTGGARCSVDRATKDGLIATDWFDEARLVPAPEQTEQGSLLGS